MNVHRWVRMCSSVYVRVCVCMFDCVRGCASICDCVWACVLVNQAGQFTSFLILVYSLSSKTLTTSTSECLSQTETLSLLDLRNYFKLIKPFIFIVRWLFVIFTKRTIPIRPTIMLKTQMQDVICKNCALFLVFTPDDTVSRQLLVEFVFKKNSFALK